MKDYSLHDRIRKIPEALSIYMNQLVYSEKRKGKDIVTMSLGEAFFDIPAFPMEQIDFIKGYHYSDSMGIPELREKIMKFYNQRYCANILNIDQIMISSGSKAIIYMIFLATCGNNDEVLIHEPAWLSYQEQVKLVGATPVFVPYYTKPKEIVNYITEKTKLIVINNPNNPAGWIYTTEELKFIYQKCIEKNVFLLLDEAYSDFVVDTNEFVSISALSDDLEGVFVVNSLSKNMGMSGWRIGYVISSKKNINALLILNQHIATCAPTVLQLYLAHYFDDIMGITLSQVQEVVEKRNRIAAYIDKIGMLRLPGTSTFYIFIKINDISVDTLNFCLYLLFKYGIATVPGRAYGKSTDQFIRIGIGAESEERLIKAIDIINMVMKNDEADEAYVSRKLEVNGYHQF